MLGLLVHGVVTPDVTQVKEKIPSLAELGGTQLYPADPSVGMSLRHTSSGGDRSGSLPQ